MVWTNISAKIFTHVGTDKNSRLFGRSIVNYVFPVDGFSVAKFLVIAHAYTTSEDLSESTQANFFQIFILIDDQCVVL